MKNKRVHLYYGLALSTLATFLIVACGKNSSNDSNANPQVTYSCPAGTYYSGGYCYDNSGQQLGTVSSMNFISDNYQYRNFTVKSSAAFQNFLKKAMGVCDRAEYSGGIYDCQSWVSGYVQVSLQTQTSQANTIRATFSTYPYVSTNYWYGYQLPSLSQFFLGLMGFPAIYESAGAMRNPLPVDLTVSAINKSAGFEGRGYGDLYTTANRSLIQVIVPTGKLEDQQFNYELAFEGQSFATGTFVRY